MSKTPAERLAQTIDRFMIKRDSESHYDKTYSGIISAILFEPDTDKKDQKFGTYKVRYGAGNERVVKLTDGIVHEVGERVNVLVPLNNPNRVIIEPIIKELIPYKIVYDNETDSFVEYRKVETDGKIYELASEYKLTVENKGTDEEEVTKMTLPDGQEIYFENFDKYSEWIEEVSVSDDSITFTSGNRSVVNTETGEETAKTSTYGIQRDSNGRITQITDENGNVTNITRNNEDE